MPARIRSPPNRIPIQPLTADAFAPFGTVIENPLKSSSPSSNAPSSSYANQGTAIKYTDISHLTDHYALAPSKRPARAIVNMFVCAPRRLRTSPTTPSRAPQTTPPSTGAVDLETGTPLHEGRDASTAEKGTAPTGAIDLETSTPLTEGRDTEDSHPHSSAPDSIQLFDVSILERHPFTPQTFIPLGLPATPDHHTHYLVIVAPTLPSRRSKPSSSSSASSLPKPYPTPDPAAKRDATSAFASARPSPYTNATTPPSPQSSPTSTGADTPRGRGMPDLRQIRAFLARGNQAVTYGSGTWHAPMVVLGETDVEFVVVQYANGVDNEDCQEVMLERVKGAGEGAVVEVDVDGVLARERRQGGARL